MSEAGLARDLASVAAGALPSGDARRREGVAWGEVCALVVGVCALVVAALLVGALVVHPCGTADSAARMRTTPREARGLVIARSLPRPDEHATECNGHGDYGHGPERPQRPRARGQRGEMIEPYEACPDHKEIPRLE